MDFEKLLFDLVKPLVVNSEDLLIKQMVDNDNKVVIHVLVPGSDIGRVIGKGGNLANSIRSLVYAGALKNKQKVRIEFDSY